MGHSVLVVEDEETVRRFIVRILDLSGFSTVHTGEAAEAISLVRASQNPVELAIVDIVMPGTSGLDFAAELERQFPAVRILYISGYVDSIAANVIQRRSPLSLLLKPFTELELLDRINKLLESPPRVSPGRAGLPPSFRRMQREF